MRVQMKILGLVITVLFLVVLFSSMKKKEGPGDNSGKSTLTKATRLLFGKDHAFTKKAEAAIGDDSVLGGFPSNSDKVNDPNYTCFSGIAGGVSCIKKPV